MIFLKYHVKCLPKLHDEMQHDALGDGRTRGVVCQKKKILLPLH